MANLRPTHACSRGGGFLRFRVVSPFLFPLTASAALLLATVAAHASALTVGETQRLLRGETVVRAQSLRRGDRRYVGGVTYSVVDADADDLAQLLGNIDAWRRILPKTRSALSIGAVGGDSLVELTQGSALVQAKYTIRLRRDGRGVRFWMDPGGRHDIEDAWGFVRTASSSTWGRACCAISSRTMCGISRSRCPIALGG